MEVEGPTTMTEASTRVRLHIMTFSRTVGTVNRKINFECFPLSGGRGRYGDGPYNCNGGDGGNGGGGK